ncbi:hypothetical protein [Pelosinus sp. sgz500959]|uniref:hypothetical protein n=1 Tax=Pelosinus sp. sgz500959 TaxID=3242472 RepID=UPI00366E07D5
MKINDINLIGKLADLKDTEYKNTLAISILIELLIDKGIFTREEFTHKSWDIEKSTLSEIISKRRLELLHTSQLHLEKKDPC